MCSVRFNQLNSLVVLKYSIESIFKRNSKGIELISKNVFWYYPLLIVDDIFDTSNWYVFFSMQKFIGLDHISLSVNFCMITHVIFFVWKWTWIMRAKCASSTNFNVVRLEALLISHKMYQNEHLSAKYALIVRFYKQNGFMYIGKLLPMYY